MNFDSYLVDMPCEVENILVEACSLCIVDVTEEDWGTLQDIQMLPLILVVKADSVWDIETENIKSVHSFRLCDFLQEKIHLVVC